MTLPGKELVLSSKMRQGDPLNDEDRMPWLKVIAEWVRIFRTFLFDLGAQA
jgi:hypothetical protein